MQTEETTPRTALFISHATPEDNHFVRWLGAKLTVMGYEVWADVMRLRGGSDWSRELENALRKRAVKMLLVCTPSGLDKRGVRNEIEMGANLARQLGDDEFIVPLRLEPYEAPFRVAHAQYIDFKNSWARGLVELTELLEEKGIPKGKPSQMQTWLEGHAEGSSKLVVRSEPLVSNWLEIEVQPDMVHYCEPPVGSSIERFQLRNCHTWPCVPHRGGVITFASPDASGLMGGDLPGKVVSSIRTKAFLEAGWAEYGIEAYQAQNMYTDIGSQAFDGYCSRRGMKGYMGSGKRLSWWADIKTAPLDKVKFDWGYRRGARQIIGHSEKRRVHWHYAININLRAFPLRHLRIAARLVFSENGMDAIEDVRRAHGLRRSLAKGWRNARWRDMLCAFLWWLSDNTSQLMLPVAEGAYISARIPPLQFSCPVSVPESDEEPADDDDPEIPIEDWDDEPLAEEQI